MDDSIKEITIHVRSPSLNQTLSMKVNLNETILTLKQSIEPIHPYHPPPTSQRIIYSGKLLEDSDILINVLKKVDDNVIPTFHLVSKPSLQQQQGQQLKQQQEQQQQEQQQQREQQRQHNNAPNYNMPRTDEATFQQQQLNSPVYPSVLPGGYQVIFLDGQYYLAPVLVPSQPIQNTLIQQQQLNQHQNIEQQVEQRLQRRQPLLFRYGPILVRPANAQLAATIWLALKLAVVLFMLCQGASIERIIIFHTIAFIFFLYQTGRLRVVLRRVRAEDLNQANNNINNNNRNEGGVIPQEPINGNNQVNDSIGERRNRESEPTTTGEGSSTENNAVRRRPVTRLDVWKRCAYAFVASLWPSYGVDPRIAQAFENDNNNNNNNE
ncbi:MAG: hypothetical protein EXX96DRAFT_557936 [Benjaminiella poitrasii]|nr:MAG: hypothetical protein EXX96DRAFT_557936 [Benjaminiella poitrasii]